MEHRAKIIGLALLGLAFGSEALTLGRLNGAAWVGRSLDIAIPVQMSAGEESASLCFQAEVFYADTKQFPSRVRVAVEPSTQPQSATIRVTSSTPIDEPVVTVYLHTECGQKTTRRYVMLADMPSEVATVPALPVDKTVAGASLMAESRLATIPAKAQDASEAASEKSARKRVRKSARTSDAAANRNATVVAADTPQRAVGAKSRTAPSASRPRLQLDHLDFFSDRIADIEAYAPVAISEDALRNMQRMKTLEESVATLLALNTKNEAVLQDLRAKLKEAEANQFPVEIIYGLGVLLLAALAALALLWQRQRGVIQSRDNWWAPSAASPAELETINSPPSTILRPASETKDAPVTSKKDHGRASEFFGHADSAHAVDVNLMEMSESGFDDLMQLNPKAAKPAATDGPKVPPSIAHRGLDTSPSLDLLMQAEFFMAIERGAQASQILTQQIAHAQQPNPFVYLELLSILHRQGDKVNFEQVSHEFSGLFNCRVPEFVIFKNEGRSLESYPTVLAAITAVWPESEALQLLEACLVRESGDARAHPYDLAAFRDLADLHSLASAINADPQAEFQHPDAPLATTPAALAVAPLDLLAEDANAYDGGLDLDLSEPVPLEVAPTPPAEAHYPAISPEAEDESADAQWLGSQLNPDDGNLIDFELPSQATPIRSRDDEASK